MMRYYLMVVMLAVVVGRAVAQEDVVDWSRPIVLTNGIVEYYAWEGTLMRVSESNAIKIGIGFADGVALRPPEVSSRPIEAPYFVVRSETNQEARAFTLSDEGGVISWMEHTSPWDGGVAQSNKAAALVEYTGIVDALKALKPVMSANIDAAQAVDQTVFSADQRTQFKALKEVTVDVAKSVNDLRKTLLRFYKVTEVE